MLHEYIQSYTQKIRLFKDDCGGSELVILILIKCKGIDDKSNGAVF